MKKAKRYYVRQLTETNKLVVEKSDILNKDKYVIDLAQRTGDSFEMLSESSDEYAIAVQGAINLEELNNNELL